MLGFKNRGVKVKSYYEMKNIKAPNIIFEICFCDSKRDIDIYNKYSWDELSHILVNAIDRNIPETTASEVKKGYVVTNYLPAAYSSYDGIDINNVLKYFNSIKCYVRGNSKGIWIETETISIQKCQELKSSLGSWFYEIKE